MKSFSHVLIIIDENKCIFIKLTCNNLNLNYISNNRLIILIMEYKIFLKNCEKRLFKFINFEFQLHYAKMVKKIRV